MGLSYIIYEEDKGTGTRLDKPYKPTDVDTIKKIAIIIMFEVRYFSPWKPK